MGSTKPSTKPRQWDSAEHLKTEEEMALYLEACLDEGDAALIAHALGFRFHAEAVSA